MSILWIFYLFIVSAIENPRSIFIKEFQFYIFLSFRFNGRLSVQDELNPGLSYMRLFSQSLRSSQLLNLCNFFSFTHLISTIVCRKNVHRKSQKDFPRRSSECTFFDSWLRLFTTFDLWNSMIIIFFLWVYLNLGKKSNRTMSMELHEQETSDGYSLSETKHRTYLYKAWYISQFELIFFIKFSWLYNL